MMQADFGKLDGWQLVASSLAAVYATENTRAAIFDAFRFGIPIPDGLSPAARLGDLRVALRACRNAAGSS